MSYFSDSLLKQVRAYSNGHAESSKDLYSKRNQNINNLIETLYYSKLCEWKTYYILRDAGKKVTQPCMKILEPQEKSYEADLLIYDQGIKIHVKSQTIKSALRYGTSFCLQKNDPIVTNPTRDHWLALTIYNNEDDIRLLGFLNATHAVYGETRLGLSSKVALYLDQNQQYM